ncbi:hypothetical protein WOLCODRAFT_165014 [Wolfiporia cocos MD-104 SS10]|uniref:MFS general substrate transporter n=1 Tax=Wolfiporia cocos (strain MD-104) TaxID=742152 RepID=A0A2H3K5C5_WOLCO|nr:hypothetical protein WOLCODRAFT_165014 [Wolfiporia cocos MD-104 SS10]
MRRIDLNAAAASSTLSPALISLRMLSVGVGISLGLLLVPALSMQSHHWRRRRSFVMGNFFMGFESTGFVCGVRAAVFMMLVLFVINNSLLTTRHNLLPTSACSSASGASSSRLFVNAHRLSSTLVFLTVRAPSPLVRLGSANRSLSADRDLVFVTFAAANKSAVIVFAIFFGAFSGAFISLLPTMLASMSRGPTEMGCVPRSLSLSPLPFILAGNTVGGASGECAGKWWAEAGAEPSQDDAQLVPATPHAEAVWARTLHLQTCSGAAWVRDCRATILGCTQGRLYLFPPLALSRIWAMLGLGGEMHAASSNKLAR